MAPVKNPRLILKEFAQGSLIPGKTTIYDESETIDLETVPLNGGFLSKTLVLSMEPYIAVKLIEPFFGYKVGEPISNYGVSVVLRSERDDVKVGDHVYGEHTPFAQYFIKNDLSDFRVLKNEEGLPWSAYLGIGGMPGQTAYFGWREYSHAKKGETVFVSSGAGPVGATVIQLAKAEGLKVIASAGSPEKIEYIRECGADVAFNYKTESTEEVLAREGPIDIYWDCVGGATLDAVLKNAAFKARIIVAGMTSNFTNPTPVHNLFSVVSKHISLTGFVVTFLADKYLEEFYATIPKKIASGELKRSEEIVDGFEKTIEVVLDVMAGRNKAKVVLKVADE